MRSSAFAVLVLLLAASAGLAADKPLAKRLQDSDPDVRSAAVKEVRGDPSLKGIRLILPLLADKDAYVRDYTWNTLCGVKNEEWILWMAGAIRTDRRPQVRISGAEVLGRRGKAAALPALEALLGDRELRVRVAAAASLRNFKGSEQAKAILVKGLADPRPEVRAAALESWSRIDAKGAVPKLMAALKDEDEGVRCAALRSLRYGSKDLAVDAGTYAMLEGGWRMRAQAIENSRWLRDRRVMEGLIQGLRKATRARIREDLFQALRDLTGLEIPATVGDWEAWWKQNGDGWREEGRIPRPSEDEHASGVSRYYGIPIRSDRVVFLLDGSGSMRGKMAYNDDRTKMDVARKELLRVLDELGESIRFNVIVFHTKPDAFRPSLVAADSRTRKKVETFVRKKTGRGRTNLYDAIELALADDDADTIFVLSDGAPSEGRYQFRSRIRHHVRLINRRRKIVVHTIAFGGKDVNREFLEKLARENGGVHVVHRK